MDTLSGLQQPHFHLGSNVTQVACCCFSPDGSTILSGSWDMTLKLWRTRDGFCNSTLSGIPSCGPDYSLLDIATLVERDVRSFLEKPTGVPLCATTMQLVEEHKCSEEQKICTVKTEELIKCRHFYKGELDKTRSVMNQLSSKLKESQDVSCLSQEEVLLFSSGTRYSQINQRLFQKESSWRKSFETCFRSKPSRTWNE